MNGALADAGRPRRAQGDRPDGDDALRAAECGLDAQNILTI
jgi:hypothetical protein